MKLHKNDLGCKSGKYGEVFFVGCLAVKVFKRRYDNFAARVPAVFQSEVAAYNIGLKQPEIRSYIEHFRGPLLISEIVDANGKDISCDYHLDCAYSMTLLTGHEIKIGECRPELGDQIRTLFQRSGIQHMRDCSLFFDDDGSVKHVIDFALEWHEPEWDSL